MSKKKHLHEEEKKSSPISEKQIDLNNSKSLLQKAMPHLIAIGIFLVVTIAQFYPMFSENKVVAAGDVKNFKGMSKEIIDYRETHPDEPLWTNSMFGGMPAYQVSTIYKGNLARFVNVVMTLGLPRPANLIFIGLCGFYFLLIMLGVSPWVAIVGAFGFALSSYNPIIVSAGHNTKLETMGYFPFVVAGVILIMKRKYLWGAAITALAMTAEIKANHLQISYYLLLTLGVLAVVELVSAFKSKQLKAFFISAAIAAVSISLGFVSNTSALWTTNEYAKATIRGGTTLTTNTKATTGLDEGYAFDWSYSKAETATLLVPDAFGGSSDTKLSTESNAAKTLKPFNIPDDQLNGILSQMPTYWGDPIFTSGPVYLGAVICFLFFLGILLVNSKYRWWLIGASIMSIFLAWGKNFMVFNDFLFHHFPGYNKFRTVDMALIIVQFTFPLLAALGLARVVNGNISKEEIFKKLKLAFYITAGLTAFILLAGQMGLFSFTGPNDYKIASRYAKMAGDNQQFGDDMVKALIKDRKGLLTMDSLRSLLFIVLAAGVIWAFIKNKIKTNLLIGGIALLVFVDLFFVGKRYLNEDNFADASQFNDPQETQADQVILANDKSLDYRVLNYTVDPFQDATTSYFHKSVGGYHAAKLRRYQDLIETQFYKGGDGVVDMMNTRWFIFNGQQGPAAQPNLRACGNAWFPDSLIKVNSPDEEIGLVGGIYTVKSLGAQQIVVNGKASTEATFNNHDDVIVILKDTTDLNAFRLAGEVGVEDTIALDTVLDKAGKIHHQFKKAKSGEALFVLKKIYDFEPRHVAVVDVKQFPDAAKFENHRDSTANIFLKSYDMKDMVYESNSSMDNVAVFSEIYYSPGWNVTIDEKPASHFRVNYVLRGMMIPKGKHKIEFKFEPAAYYTGEKISMFGSAIVLLLFFGVVGKSVMDMRKKNS